MIKDLRSAQRSIYGYPYLKPVSRQRPTGFFASQAGKGIPLIAGINPCIFIPAVLAFTFFFCVLFSSCDKTMQPARAEGFYSLSIQPAENIDMNAIYIIESSRNPYAVNEKTYCYGAFQISYILLEEYNKLATNKIVCGRDVTILDLYYFDTNFAIAKWYFDERLPQMMSWFGIPMNTINLLACYNWGAGNVYKWHKAGAKYNKLPKEVRNYIKKYEQLTRSK